MTEVFSDSTNATLALTLSWSRCSPNRHWARLHSGGSRRAALRLVCTHITGGKWSSLMRWPVSGLYGMIFPPRQRHRQESNPTESRKGRFLVKHLLNIRAGNGIPGAHGKAMFSAGPYFCCKRLRDYVFAGLLLFASVSGITPVVGTTPHQFLQ